MTIPEQHMIAKSMAYLKPVPWAFMRACFLYHRGFINEEETDKLNAMFFSKDREMVELSEVTVYAHWVRWMNRVEPQKLIGWQS